MKEVKQSLFTEDRSVYVKNMIECTAQQLELGGGFTKVSGYKTNIQRQSDFFYQQQTTES